MKSVAKIAQWKTIKKDEKADIVFLLYLDFVTNDNLFIMSYPILSAISFVASRANDTVYTKCSF